MDKFSTYDVPVDIMGRNFVDTINALKGENVHVCTEDRWYQNSQLMMAAEILPFYYFINFKTEDYAEESLPLHKVYYLEIDSLATSKLITNQRDLPSSFGYNTYPNYAKKFTETNDELMYLLDVVRGIKLDLLFDQGFFRNVEILGSDYSYIIVENFSGRHFLVPLQRIKKITDHL